MRSFLAFFLALFLLVLTPAGAAGSAAFDWTMPASLGADADGDGLIDYANSVEELEREEAKRGGFLVELRVRRSLCRKGSTYAWRSEAGEEVATGGAGCGTSFRFASEGDHAVELQVRKAGGRTRSFHREIVVRDWLIVSIGDSVASGEGNPDIPSEGGKKSRWQSSRCHRSAKAGPAQAALSLERANARSTITFVHLACSGAKVSKGLLGPYKGLDVPWLRRPEPLLPQVKELRQIKEKRRVDAVLLSIGANDVYFGPIVQFCLKWPNCTNRRFNPKDKLHRAPFPRERLPRVVTKALDRLDDEYAALAGKLDGVVPSSHVLITDYFDPTHDSQGEFCERIGIRLPWGLLQIDKKEAKWASTRILQPLNLRIAKAADRHGWTEVTGVAEAFKSHGYCADEPWVVQFEESYFDQKGEKFFSRLAGFLHPNVAGHQQVGSMIARSLTRVLDGEAPPDDDDEIVIVTETEEGEEPDETPDEASLEHAVLIGLILAAVTSLVGAAGVAAARFRRSRRSAAPGAKEGGPLHLPPERWPDRDDAMKYGELLWRSGEWVHRRVESIEIVDERLVRRRVSVDFTPELPPRDGLSEVRGPVNAPIALLSKEILTRFDLRDENGASVPLATSEENAAFAAAYMLALAEEALGEEPPRALQQLCWTIARGEPEEAQRALRALARYPDPRRRKKLEDHERFPAVTSVFAKNFAVIVEVEAAPRRRVLKLAYDQVVSGKLTLLQKLGLDPVLLRFRIPELSDAGSRHVEFVRADGLDILNAQLIWREPDGSFRGIEGAKDGGEAHLRLDRQERGTRALAGVQLRASRSGLLAGGPWLAGLSAAALTAAWFALPELAGNSSSAPSTLLAIPAVLGAYLGTRPPHPLEAAMLWGARRLVFLSGALAFVGAGALALDQAIEPLRIIVGVVALGSWASVVGLAMMRVHPTS